MVRAPHILPRFFHSKHADSSWFQPLLVYGARTSHFAAFFHSKLAVSSWFQSLLVYGARTSHFAVFFHSKHADSSWFQPLLVYGARTSYRAAFLAGFLPPTLAPLFLGIVSFGQTVSSLDANTNTDVQTQGSIGHLHSKTYSYMFCIYIFWLTHIYESSQLSDNIVLWYEHLFS